jgi:hypothetical protein
MATEKDTKGKKEDGDATGPAESAGAPRRSMAIRLTPVNNSDQPVVANYSSIDVAPGMTFIDFGFIEPGMLAALPRVARQGGKLPERIGGKLAVRVAMGYDALANLHQQIGRVLAGLQAAARQAQSGGRQQQ